MAAKNLLRGVKRWQWWVWYYVPALAMVTLVSVLLSWMQLAHRVGPLLAFILASILGGGLGVAVGYKGRKALLALSDVTGPWVIVETADNSWAGIPKTPYQSGVGYVGYLCPLANVPRGKVYTDWEQAADAAQALQNALRRSPDSNALRRYSNAEWREYVDNRLLAAPHPNRFFGLVPYCE